MDSCIEYVESKEWTYKDRDSAHGRFEEEVERMRGLFSLVGYSEGEMMMAGNERSKNLTHMFLRGEEKIGTVTICGSEYRTWSVRANVYNGIGSEDGTQS